MASVIDEQFSTEGLKLNFDVADKPQRKPRPPFRWRIIVGIAAICAILMATVGTTHIQFQKVNDEIARLDKTGIPAVLAIESLTRDIETSLGSLRGWITTGDTKFKTERTAIWTNIEHARNAIDAHSKHWANPQNVENWSTVKTVLDEYKTAQASVEAIANSDGERPANTILFQEAVPRAAAMLSKITETIDLEVGQYPIPKRRHLLGALADVRSTTEGAWASISAYLLSGDLKFVDKFNETWSKNERRLADIRKLSGLFSDRQRAAFADFSENR